MILDKLVEVTIINHNFWHYKNLGYDVKCKNKIKVKPEELSSGSHCRINCACDDCGNETNIKYQDYLKVFNKNNKYVCEKCRQLLFSNFNTTKKNLMKKNRLVSNKEKYGVDNIFQLESIKDKMKETCLLKYGFDCYTKTAEFIEKSENTSMKNYGVKNPMKNSDVKKLSIDNSKLKRLETTLLLYKEIGIINIMSDGNYEFNCDNECDHQFLIDRHLLYNRKKLNTILCTICNPIGIKNSGLEIGLLNFIKENYNGEILINKRDIIPPLELDIYLPELKLAFEFNGLYWHNEINKNNDYHLNKTEECEKKDIQLIQIWEDNWLYSQNIIKSMIINKLNKTLNKIYARKTEIKEINNNNLVRKFLDNNHIQGFIGSKVKIGLFYDNELVSLMTFGSRRIAMGKKTTNEGEYELLRFCNKLNTNIIGGASKLFKYFINNYKPQEITTYADRSISQGKLYKILGFELQGKTEPNYYYIIDRKKYHRFNFRKDILIKQGYDLNKTEHEIMLERKIYRIYDSGNLKYSFLF